MKFKKNLRKFPLVLLFLSVLVGFADCHFEARQFVYQLNSCPDKSWKLIEHFKDDEFSITKLNLNETQEPFVCKNLDLYKIDKNFADKDQDAKWAQFHSYVGIQKNSDSCNLIISTKYIGPFLSEKKSIEEIQNWEKITTKFAKHLLGGSSIHLNELSLKSSIIRDQKVYKDWCVNFPSL